MKKDDVVRSWLFTHNGDSKYESPFYGILIKGTLNEAAKFIQRSVKEHIKSCNRGDLHREAWHLTEDTATDKLKDLTVTQDGQKYLIHGEVKYRERNYLGPGYTVENHYTMYNMIEVNESDYGPIGCRIKENGGIKRIA